MTKKATFDIKCFSAR